MSRKNRKIAGGDRSPHVEGLVGAHAAHGSHKSSIDITELVNPDGSFVYPPINVESPPGAARSLVGEIVYIPVLFHIKYDDSVTMDAELKASIYEDLSREISNINATLASGIITPPLNYVYDHILDGIDEHGTLANCQFFLVDRIPKKDATLLSFRNNQISVGIPNPPISTVDIEQIIAKKNAINSSTDPEESATLSEELYALELEYYLFLGDHPGALFYNSSEHDGDVPILSYILHSTTNPNSTFNSYADFDVFTSVSTSPSVGATYPVMSIRTSYSSGVGASAGSIDLGSFISDKLSTTFYLNDLQALLGSDGTVSNVFIHEFLHGIKLLHGQDSIKIKGVNIRENSLADALSNYIKFKLTANVLNNTEYPFLPPFSWGPNLSDTFEEVDSEEKKFVEYVYNTLIPTITSNFTQVEGDLDGFTFNLPLSQVVSEESRPHQNINLITLVNTLPSFWGGSYTINEGGSKSLLINPTPLVTIDDYSLGDSVGGGLLFYKDMVTQEGLIISTEDMTGYNVFGNREGVAGADSFEIGAGEQNTLDILATSYIPITSSTTKVRAANSAAAYEGGGHTDWYLPSRSELSEARSVLGINSALGNIGNFILTTHWSSSENGDNAAWTVNFSADYLQSLNKIYTRPTRAIRRQVLGGDGEYSDTRKGPNVTMYNPVCSQDDNGEYTVFNTSFWYSLNWYNPAMPVFPNNTRVEDMFSEELCPCLYVEQSLSGDEEARYTVMNSNGTFTNDTFFKALKDRVSSEGVIADLTIFGALNPEDIFGENPQWFKTISTSEGDLVIPTLPVYVGFISGAQVPAKIKLSSSYLPSYLEQSFVDDSSMRNSGYGLSDVVSKYLQIGGTNPENADYNPFNVGYSSSVENFNFLGGDATVDEELLEYFKFSNSWKEDISSTLYGTLNQNTLADIMHYPQGLFSGNFPSKFSIDTLNEVAASPPENSNIGKYIEYGDTVYGDSSMEGNNSLQDHIDLSIDYVYNFNIDVYANIGCLDSEALNYNPEAVISGVCRYAVEGCMDPESGNFNPEAVVDNGSCIDYTLNSLGLHINYVCADTENIVCNLYTPEGHAITNAQLAEYFISEGLTEDGGPWPAYIVGLLQGRRYDCEESPLASTLIGPENTSGGCIDVADNSMCVYPNGNDFYSCGIGTSPDGSQDVYLGLINLSLSCSLSSRAITASGEFFLIGRVRFRGILYNASGVEYIGRFIKDLDDALYEYTEADEINRDSPLFFRNQLNIPMMGEVEKEAKNLMKIKASLDKIINFTN